MHDHRLFFLALQYHHGSQLVVTRCTSVEVLHLPDIYLVNSAARLHD